jgi:hypothetical protein
MEQLSAHLQIAAQEKNSCIEGKHPELQLQQSTAMKGPLAKA